MATRTALLRHMVERHEALCGVFCAALGAWLGGVVAGALAAFVGAALGVGFAQFVCSHARLARAGRASQRRLRLGASTRLGSLRHKR